MSTKIYDAYKVNARDVWGLLWKIRDTAEINIRRLLTAHYIELVRTMDPDTAEYRKARKKDPEREEALFRLHRAHETIRNGFRENVTRPERDTYSLEVSVALYPHRNFFYLRTFCEPTSVVGEALDFVPKMVELEDFHYQNSTDRPKKVTAEAWDKRERTWDAIFKGNSGIGNHVTLEILTWEGFYRLDPWFELARKWAKEPPVLPSREEVWAEKIKELKLVEKTSSKSGRIDIVSTLGAVSFVEKRGRKWFSNINGVEKDHKNLNLAADHAYFEHLPESSKELILRMIEQHNEREALRKQRLQEPKE